MLSGGNVKRGPRIRERTTRSVAAAWAGALAAFVLGKILEIALLFLRFFLRARSRSHSADASGLDRVVRSRILAIALVLAACGDDAGAPTFVFGGDGGARDAGMDAGARDAGPPFVLDAETPPPDDEPDAMPPEMDAAKPRRCRDLRCGKLDDECHVGVCDPETVRCRAVPRPDGTACGDADDDACTAPDTCNKGVCLGNHAAKGKNCGDQSVECHFDDECNGKGACVEGGVWDEFTTCGDATDTECDKPDSCDDVGRCVPRYATVDAPCGDQGVLCRYDDGCDGLGFCKENGFWPVTTSCATGPEPPLALCHPAPYQCDAGGSCVSLDEPDGTVCGNQTPTDQCDGANECKDGRCWENPLPYGTLCELDPTVTSCNLHDICDGTGACVDNFAPYGTLCAAAPGECYQERFCDGTGADCPAAQPIPHAADYACGGSGSGCLCDGTGTCEDRSGPSPCP